MVSEGPVGLIAELRRRHVLRVVGFYAIAVWLLLQIGNVVSGPLNLPNWMMIALIVAVVAGFPIVAVLAWVFDLTPDGLVRTGPRSARTQLERLDEFEDAVTDSPRLWIDIAIIGVLLTIVAYLLIKPDASAQRFEASIAVLPFLDLSERGDNKYFSDGIAEELLDSLTRIQGLRVAARTSSFAQVHYADVRELGDRLGVATVLEGSVRRDGDRVRINAQLIDVTSGFRVWSETYDRTLDDIFVVQNDIARSIAGAMRIRLMPGAGDVLVAPATRDMDAYDLYLRGRAALRDAVDEEGVRQAIQYFDRALALDPRFALADAGLCSAYWNQYQLTREQSLVDRALDACRAARVRDETLPEVHVALGGLYAGLQRYDRALEAYRRTLELDSSNADALRGIGVVKGRTGDADASEAMLRRVVEIDPNYWRSYSALGGLLYGQGRLEEAAEVFRQGTISAPGSAALWSNLGGVLVSLGRREAAADAFEASIAVVPTVSAYANAGTNYFFMGRFQRAREMYEQAAAIAPHDFRWHSFIADACRQLADGRDCEARRLGIAVALAEQELAMTPGDASTRARLAWMHRRLGADDLAQAHLRDALAQDAEDPEVLRSAALLALADGNADSAIDYLARARARGYPGYQLRMHPEFAALQAHPRFLELLNEGEEQR